MRPPSTPQVTFIDSPVIGILAVAHIRPGRWGGRVALVGAGGRVERLLHLTGLATVMDVRPSPDYLDAIAGSMPQEKPRRSHPDLHLS